MILIAGLGNPGKDYELTRHNVGFLIVNKFAESLCNVKFYSKFKSQIAITDFNSEKIILLKPQTFMNESGSAISLALNFYKNEINQILVVHDDIDLEFGVIKFKKNGGTAGHKGLESIVQSIGDSDFDRLRFGVGRPPGLKEAANYVLKKFNKNELKKLDIFIDLSVCAIKDYISNGINYCMNKYN